MIGVVGIMGLGVLGMTGCSIEGDTFSGVVTQVDCASATTTTGQLNCGSGTQTDDHHSEEIAAE
jgi:hypothetical protein